MKRTLTIVTSTMRSPRTYSITYTQPPLPIEAIITIDFAES
jgi:hypothetical protein